MTPRIMMSRIFTAAFFMILGVATARPEVDAGITTSNLKKESLTQEQPTRETTAVGKPALKKVSAPAKHTPKKKPSSKVIIKKKAITHPSVDREIKAIANEIKKLSLDAPQQTKKTIEATPVVKEITSPEKQTAKKTSSKKTTSPPKIVTKKDSTKKPPAVTTKPPTNKKLLSSKKLSPADIPAAKKNQSLSKASEIAAVSGLISGELNTKLAMPEQKKPTPAKKLQTRSPDDDPADNENNSLDDEDDDEDDDDDDDLIPSPAPPSKKIMIRVLLKEFPTEQKVTFAIQNNRGFVLESPIASGKRARWSHEILNLLAFKHNLFLLTANGSYKRIKTNELAIASIDGDLKIDNFRYRGTMYLRIDPKTKMVQLVNKVNLDDYIYAVLRYESLSYWPLEIQKVQAVASRSYAVRQIKVTRSNTTTTSFYDIKNTNSHQVYNGNHNSVHLREAVNETHNLILTYNGDIALTMFDICCGGIIPGYMKKRDADKPYLYRKTRCTYCHNKANFEWNCAFNKDTLLQNMLDSTKLAAKAKKIGKIIGISLKEKDRAGIVHRVLIHGSKNNISFTNNEFKSALGSKAKSNAYVVKKLQDDITVHGYGFGHNMGLCQLGARELVSRGKNYQEILDFYFPKTRLMRLKVI